ncbi:MAG: DUF1501 domain-containing protein [SAR202 cluster bacterium]|nr:DUF1501 domain-containing protein [SAR202 cluster bacterium]
MNIMENNNHVLVVLQLTGGNDFINTIVPYSNPHYYDARKKIVVPEDQVLQIDDNIGFHQNMAPIKELYDQGSVAIIQGIGYPNSSRSHFRALDIWHTCEPETVGTEGWLGKAITALDPKKENVLTGVNFGRGLPRALSSPGVPVTSVGDLDNYGLMTPIQNKNERTEALKIFKSMYAPAIGNGPVMDYLSQTGQNLLVGADMLKVAPINYKSEIEYGNTQIAKSLRDVARVHLANLGTQIFFVSQGGYDTHSTQTPVQPVLIEDLSKAINDFFQDLRNQNASKNVAMLVFTEFGRRMQDNGSGTDHGSGGGAFIIGDSIKGGLYSEYPRLEPENWENGEDLEHTIDFRGVYGTLLEQWMNIEPSEIVGGQFEQIGVF